MTANQRRPGFRLPWSPDADDTAADSDAAAPESEATPGEAEGEVSDVADPAATEAAVEEPASEAPVTPAGDVSEGAPGNEATTPAAAATTEPASEPSAELPAPAAATTSETGDDFMRDLVAAMRGVADEAREAGMSDLRAHADEKVHELEADAGRRQDDLRSRAEADVTGIGEWERAEAERIKTEAEQRRVARRAQLDQQLAADTSRTEAETRAVRDRVTQYERELTAFYAQLTEITDPAAFAAAAKRMPRAPSLMPSAPVAEVQATPAAAAPAETTAPADTSPATDHMAEAPAEAPAEAAVPETPPGDTAVAGNGASPAADADETAMGEAALAARLAQLDASHPAEPAEAAAAPTAAPSGEPVTTEVIVKGLGSFGAITGFRQSLSGVDGIDAVALSLGQTGEFVFRATHAAGFDVRAAIAALEGEGAKVEDRPEGGLRVTLERAR
jgi:hypothetical protein